MNQVSDASKIAIRQLFSSNDAISLVVTTSLFPFLLPVIGLTALATWGIGIGCNRSVMRSSHLAVSR